MTLFKKSEGQNTEFKESWRDEHLSQFVLLQIQKAVNYI